MNQYFIKTNWDQVVAEICSKHQVFLNAIEKEYEHKIIYPKKELIFNCFNFFNVEDLKVVFLGQDPYHGENQAMGLAFSVPTHMRTPSSLKNIFKELANDLKIERTNPDLSDWAGQGILFLNTSLTVEASKPLSHSKIGWESLINDIIKYVNFNHPKTIFILLGNHAKKYEQFISNKDNIIFSFHPSGLSAYRGFFGSKIFSKTNTKLIEMNQKLIEW
ncbi:MAG: uracil-DNA glycosylase [Mycoplasmoidaceae bacterium]